MSNEKSAPHEIKHSKLFIEDEIKSLFNEKIMNGQCSWETSERIGIIMHYLSDFFCYVHSDSYEGSILQHHYYEFKHSRYSFKNFKTIIRNLNKVNPLYLDIKSVDKYLERQYRTYRSKTPSAARDLIYSLKICTTVSCSIIDSLVREYNNAPESTVSNSAIDGNRSSLRLC